MKNHRLKVLSLALLTAIVITPVYAGSDAREANNIHCAYSNDTAQNSEGNYVRIIWPQVNQNTVICMPYDSSLSITSNMIKQENIPVGSNTWGFQVCSDANCNPSTSKSLGNDTFTIVKNQDGTYSASPQYFSFTLKGYYPAVNCGSSTNQLSEAFINLKR